jgi:hypothetical protein
MYRFDEFRNFGKNHVEMMSASASSLAKLWQTVLAESTEYSKTSFGNSSAFLEKLAAAKSFDQTLQTRSEYLKTAYEGFAGYLSKVGDLYSNFAKEAFKPVETAFSKGHDKA